MNGLNKKICLTAMFLLLFAVAFQYILATQKIYNVVIATGSVSWSEEAQLYNSTVLPCVMDNAVRLGMPAMVKLKATCVIVKCAVGIAERTDEVVDVMDIRAAFLSYMYAGMGYDEDYSCNYLYKCETGENVTGGVNCIEGTGFQTVNCTEVWGWVYEHADAINAALNAACTACGAAPPYRPVIPEFPVVALTFIIAAGVSVVIIRWMRMKRPRSFY